MVGQLLIVISQSQSSLHVERITPNLYKKLLENDNIIALPRENFLLVVSV